MPLSPIHSDLNRTAVPQRSKPLRRHGSLQIGLQGKLIFSFMFVLLLTLGTSCWLFSTQGSRRVAEIMGDQAKQISFALSLATKSSMAERNHAELKRVGLDLLKAHNIVFVSFLDADGRSIALSSRDPEFLWDTVSLPRNDMTNLTQVRRGETPALGEYLAVMTPVFNTSASSPVPSPMSPLNLKAATPGAVDIGRARLLGYVVVGLSQVREQAMLRNINTLIAGMGTLVVLLCLPMAVGLVHRIFLPIRQLMIATRRIARGDLDTQVAIDRTDLIGTLARSFNEMVLKVRGQQLQLESANAQLESVNAGLEKNVRERTAELEAANQRLNREMAEKEDFLRAVSHDLNAPLRNISGMTAMLLMKNREKFDEEVIHRLERIQKNARVETDLISELLDLSRIKTSREKIEKVELEPLVRDLAGVFECDLTLQKIELVIDGCLPALDGEKARLRQVFQNLIDNAIKYMGDGAQKEIHVGCRSAGKAVEFYVRDTGVGIDPADMGKVFNVFRRGKAREVQAVAGKGVGLTTVKSIIETHGGTIWVESELGKGSTFRFTIGEKHRVNSTSPSDEPRVPLAA